mmetsp:Transcript_13256/g.45339  ORF Transcript_13256/g.45339 Transcript_13256/m.45339 type:complete len:215 (-) Transcript_13256:624-1268(-)
MRMLSSLPSKKSRSSAWTRGTRVLPPTRTTWCTSFLSIFASLSTRATGLSVRLKRSPQSSSNLARDTGTERSTPWCTASTSTDVWVADDKARFASSHCLRTRWRALGSPAMSMPLCFFLKAATQWSMSRWSKSSPPRCVSPFVARTSKTPLSMVRSVTSKVPPPRSKTRMFFSPSFLSMPYAMAAAVGSLMMRCTVMPEIVPASLVAWRWASLK